MTALIRLASLLKVASRRQRKTASQKAAEIAQTATWLAKGLEGQSAAPEIEAALDRAHEALRVVSESAMRNSIVAYLMYGSRRPSPETVRDVRGYIAASLSEPASSLVGDVENLTDDTVLTALLAWSGGKKVAGVDKWTATSAVFRECGLPSVDPDSLRKAWNRRDQ